MRHLLLILTLLLTLAPPAPAQCPAAVNIGAQSSPSSIRITWANLPGAPAASFWRIHRHTTQSLSGATLLDTRGGGTFEYIDTPPDRSQTYHYFIEAVGPTPACPSSGFVAAPIAARLGDLLLGEISATLGCGTINLSWPPFPDATAYVIYRQPLYRASELHATLSGATTTFTDQGAPGERYIYFIYARTTCGNGIANYTNYLLMPGTPSVPGNLPPAIINAGIDYTIPFSIDAAFNTPTSSRWFKDGQPLSVSQNGRIRPADTQRITIADLRPEDTGLYRVELTLPSCGTLSQEMLLAVRPTTPACPADFNHSGDLTVQDVFDFLAAYFAGCP